LGGGFVPGLSELDSQRQILAYALLFGYAQQLGTRFIDDRAQSILDSLPSKDPEAKQPAPPVQAAPGPGSTRAGADVTGGQRAGDGRQRGELTKLALPPISTALASCS
jgi:hypothetical protein